MNMDVATAVMSIHVSTDQRLMAGKMLLHKFKSQSLRFLASKIVFVFIKNVGFQKGEALEKLIREARFSIYPSEWYENCPFSVMESQMYGTPVLGANIGGIPELIQVGKTGELFESGNAEDLKKKIEKLWGDKKLCAEYSANCKDISFDTIDEYYEKIMKVY